MALNRKLIHIFYYSHDIKCWMIKNCGVGETIKNNHQISDR